MSLPASDNERYTYRDYLTWDDGERWELIDGVLYNMSPAPNRRHQRISLDLATQLNSLLSGRPCEVYAAPFDVRLPKGDEADTQVATVVQPDIVVICDPDKLDDRGVRGPPEFVVEILSPSTSDKDRTIKMALYENRGVKEYWIIDPEDNTITVHLLGPDGRFDTPVKYEGKGNIDVVSLPGLVLDLDAVFKSK
ncbi:MAG: Uma2 family endonuclease [Deltaproteobacteria bacterium]|nr:Uma2 family endonuclease [Deltaproteobacteria bacterium]